MVNPLTPMSVTVFTDGIFLKIFPMRAPIAKVRQHLTSYGIRWTDYLTVPGLPVLSDHLTLESLETHFVRDKHDNATLYLYTVGFPKENIFFKEMRLECAGLEEPIYICLANNVHLRRVNEVLQYLFDPNRVMLLPPILMKVKVPSGSSDEQIEYLRMHFAADPKKRMDCDCGCVQREVHWVDFDYDVSEGAKAGPA
jgi:hypothetical protein